MEEGKQLVLWGKLKLGWQSLSSGAPMCCWKRSWCRVGGAPGQQLGLQLSHGKKAQQEQQQQQQGGQPQEQRPQALPEGTLPEQQQGPHVLLDKRLPEAEEAAAAKHMQGIGAEVLQDMFRQQPARHTN